MQKLRRQARKYPLRAGLRFTLPLQIPAQNPDSGSRPVPFVSTTEPATLELVEALQTGVDKTSQIWTARVMETPETVLVMKIVQLSMCVISDLDDQLFWGEWEYPPDFAPREAWVYAQIRALQGLYVPYFFGIHKIETPSKEVAEVLVLEYIPGQSIYTVHLRLLRSRRFGRRVYLREALLLVLIVHFTHFTHSLSRGLRRSTRLSRLAAGLFVQDWARDNFMLTGPPGKQVVVALDLRRATLCKKEDQEEASKRQQCQFCDIIRTALLQADDWEDDENSVLLPRLDAWAEQNLGNDLWEVVIPESELVWDSGNEGDEDEVSEN
ncbi:hypothetical protein B0H15DRAFT_781194 [Mycena belliarum]|uniref:Uncharacterized protein n=1 Tax=Mycena belliarum TaxID=1033014 RepID=A0AAD6U280_9AGAR|nr:hypothetical protein B0H15DRAFT_781194 [Mycena belliae]